MDEIWGENPLFSETPQIPPRVFLAPPDFAHVASPVAVAGPRIGRTPRLISLFPTYKWNTEKTYCT